MTAPTPTPQEIARRLSPAQRHDLMSFDWDTRWGISWPSRKIAWFSRAGVADHNMERGWHLSPLGLAVRAELERMEARDG